MKPESGKCRFCGCTDSTPCRTPPSGEPCAWSDKDRTVCTAPRCMRAWGDLKKKVDYNRSKANRRPTSAEVHRAIVARRRGRGKQRKLRGLNSRNGRDAA